MKILKIFALTLSLTLAFVTGPLQSSAQCPMCKAAVESSINNGQSNAGKGLNNGILYLLAAPYLVVGALGFLWYKKYRVKNKVDMKDEKIILN